MNPPKDFSVYSHLSENSLAPTTKAFEEFMKTQRAILNSISNTAETVITPTVGDVHIHNPVGNADDLSNAIITKFPNKLTQDLYNRNKR